jgi:regulatory protein
VGSSGANGASENGAGKKGTIEKGAFESACRYLETRERCAAQVREYLGRRGFPSDEVEKAIGTLTQKRLVDDLRYARLYVEVRSRRSPRSGALLVRELSRDGIDRETAARAVDEFMSQISEEDLARRVLAKVRGRDMKILRTRAIQRLASRGFRTSFALKWLREQEARMEQETEIDPVTGVEPDVLMEQEGEDIEE